MDEIFVYFAPVTGGIHELVVQCLEGYTGYIDEKQDE